MAGTELQTTHEYTDEVPSAEWGWSGEAPRLFRTLGWIAAVFLLLMTIGNHTGHVEDLYLIGFAAALVFILVRDIIRRRKPR